MSDKSSSFMKILFPQKLLLQFFIKRIVLDRYWRGGRDFWKNIGISTYSYFIYRHIFIFLLSIKPVEWMSYISPKIYAKVCDKSFIFGRYDKFQEVIGGKLYTQKVYGTSRSAWIFSRLAINLANVREIQT